jgi:formylmethanofuran dehydrogenase subunit E
MGFLSSLIRGKEPPEGKQPREMIECPRCGRFFPRRGREHEPLCRDCAHIEKTLGHKPESGAGS